MSDEEKENRLEGKKLPLIGIGNMGGAMVGALLHKKELNPDSITASNPCPDQRDLISAKYGVQVPIPL